MSETGGERGGFPALTDRARKAIGRADLIARRRGHRAIDTHHLLLALLQPRSGVGAEILAELGLDTAALVRVIDSLDLPRREDLPPAGRMPLTRHTEEALTLAGKAAHALGHEMIGTEHLLLGLLEQGSGSAAAVLSAAGLEADTVRRLLVGRLFEGLEGRLDSSDRKPRTPPPRRIS